MGRKKPNLSARTCPQQYEKHLGRKNTTGFQMSLHRQKEKQEYELNNLCLPVPYYKQDSEQTTLRQTPYKTPHHFHLSLLSGSGQQPATVDMVPQYKHKDVWK